MSKCRQIDATIAEMRADEGVLTGVPTDGSPRRFYPVLTIAATMSVNPIFMSLLRERLRSRGVLQDRDVLPVEVFEIVDLDAIEGIVELGGPSLLDLLHRHQESNLHQMPMKDSIRLDLQLNPKAPKRVTTRSNTWADTAKDARDAASRTA